MTQNATLSAKNKVVCVYVVVCFFFNIFGVIKLGWDIAEMTGLFLVMSTGAGVLSGHSLTDTCKMFMNGARDILQGALVMCFARTIALLMTTSNTLDVFVYGISKIAGAFPPTLAIVGIFMPACCLISRSTAVPADDSYHAYHVSTGRYPSCFQAGRCPCHTVW